MANHREVAHAWAHQTGKHRKGFNMFYEGETIYSYGYHFPIARLVEHKGRTIVLFNGASYSHSTSKHKGYVRGAIPHALEVFTVDDLSRYDLPTVRDWTAKLNKAVECVAKAKRARTYGSLHMEDAARAVGEANRFNAEFDLGQRTLAVEGLDDAAAELMAKAAEERKASRERAAHYAAQRFEREAVAREAWLAGGTSYWHGAAADGTALMRIAGDTLQTSMGAEVPLEHAKRAFRMIAKVRAAGVPWVRNGHTIHVGHFQVDRIEANGDFTAGCHRFAWQEVERVAKLAGVWE